MRAITAAALVASAAVLPHVLGAVLPPQSDLTRPSAGVWGEESGLVVATENGPITGRFADNATEVLEFLGIPYAQAPVGRLRFAAPEKLTTKAQHTTANSFAAFCCYVLDNLNICPQPVSPPFDFADFTPQAQTILNNFFADVDIPQSEDCLSLNVWTKQTKGPHHEKRQWGPRPGSQWLRPVLVFFYGGRTVTGGTHTPFYNGQYLSDAEDVVVVTVNYRLNIFGFPGIPGGTQNLGFRDQRIAVEWVRDNIAAFGGDPAKITIFGQSSGAAAVDYWSYAYVEDPIVNGLISESGNALSFPLNSPAVTVSNWYNVSAAVGCGSSGNTLTCMRTKDWKKIEDAASAVASAPGGNPVRSIPPFFPSVDNEIIFPNYVELAQKGKFAKLPYLLGNNNHEQGFYILPAEAHGENITKAEGDEFLLSSFTCPNQFEAQHRRDHNVPVWQYRYFGHWSNLELYPGSGAYHGTDLEMVFGNDHWVSGIAPSKPEQEMTRVMQHAWASFANDPARGLTDLGWPQYDPSGKTLIRLAYQNKAEPQFVRPSLYDKPCSTITLGALATAT